MAETDTENNESFDKIVHQYYQTIEAGESVDPEAFIDQHAEHESELRSFFADLNALGDLPGLGAMDRTVDQSGTLRASETIPSIATGDRVTYIGQYRLLDEIARGGMGVVFKARQEKLSRVVALKMILSGSLASSTEIDRFRREARAAAGLQHPNIVSVHEIGQHDGHYFFTMDYVESESLADRLREGSLSADESARLVESIAKAMHYAHVEGVLHRDLKPANILIDKSGQPHVTDFGLAKAQADADQETLQEMTRTGQILGTPSYMSPEQASGKSELVDVRSDVYSLGAILYACLVGRAPFVGESSIETLQKVIHEEAPKVRLLNRRVPKDLETICHKALSKEPKHRYSTAGDFADDLQRFRECRPVLARPLSATARLYRWSRRRPAAALLAAILVALAFFIPTNAIFYARHEAHRAEFEKSLREKADQALDRERKALAATNVALAEARKNAYKSSLFPMIKAYEDGEYGLLSSLLRESEQRTEDGLFGWEWYFLRHALRRQSTSFDFPHKYVFVRYSSDESLIAFRRENGPIDIRRASDLQLVRTLPGDQQMYFAWHPTRAWLASAAGENELVVWDVESGERLFEFQTVDDVPKMKDRGVAWNPSGDKVAFGGYRRVDVFDIDGDRLSRRRLKCLYYARFLDWHPLEDVLAIGGANCVEVIDCESGTRIWHRYGNRIPVYGTAWNSDGTMLAAAWSYPWFRVEIYDRHGERLDTMDTGREVNTLLWNSDGDELILGGGIQKTIWWNAFEEEPNRSLSIHEGTVRSMDRSANTKSIISIDDRGNVQRFPNKVVNAHDFELRIPTGPSRIYRCAWHPSRADLIALQSEHLVQVVNVDESEIIQTFGTMDKFMAVKWHPHEPVLASLEGDGIVRFRDVFTNEEIRRLRASSRGYFGNTLDFNSDGNLLSIGNGQHRSPEMNYSAELIDVSNGERTMFGSLDNRTLARLTPDGERLVIHSSKDNETRVRIWDVGSEQLLLESPIVPSSLRQMDIHPSGQLAALAGGGGMLIVLDLATGGFKKQLNAHNSMIRNVYWSPDGRRLLTNDDDNVLKIWSTDDIELLATFRKDIGCASSWSPDGKRIATCTRDGFLRVYGSE